MPTEIERNYASYMLASLGHAEPGRRISTYDPAAPYTGESDWIGQSSTYPAWYGRLCRAGEHKAAIERNLRFIASGQENRRAGKLTEGYEKVLSAVQRVAEEGDDTGLIFPSPEYLEQIGYAPEAVQACRDFLAALAEDGAEAPEDTPVPVALREFPPEVTWQIERVAPYTSAVEFRGPWPWATPLDESARKVLLAAGFRTEIKTGRLYGHPDKTRRLPVVFCHRLPVVTYRPYVR